MKNKITTVGDEKSTLAHAIQNVLQEEKANALKFQESMTYVIKNHRHDFLPEKVTSKSTLKKCKKGLHEYKESEPIKVSKGLFKTTYTCIHCLTEMEK